MLKLSTYFFSFMEDMCDSFGNLSETDSQAISSEKPTSEQNVVSEETNIEELIAQLTSTIPSQITNSTSSSRGKTDCGGDVILGDPTNVDEILSKDEGSISSTSHNVSVLNSACQKVLKQMEFQLLGLLKKNRKEQEIIQNYLSTNFKNSFSENVKRPSLKCTGMPYFKDSYGFQPPPNEDVLRKQENNKLLPVDFIKSFSVWNGSDSKKLVKAIEKYDASKPSTIDWLKISVTDMQGRYSASECKAKWMMHLNPNINRSKWSMREMELLKELSGKYNYQNWDKIAAELGTNRNGLQCCVQYQTHTAPTEGKWTKEEDECLKNLVEKYKIKDHIPWQKVAWHFEDRSLRQCQERYAYHLGNIKKGNFTMEEDFVIVYLASKLKNFGEVAKFLPNRVSTQVRARYEYLVGISMPEFSKEEDELLSNLMVKYPRNWGKISENFKNRSRIQCRRRWAYLQRKIQLDVDGDSINDEYGEPLQESDGNRIHRSEIDAENVKRNIPLVSKPPKEDRKYPEIYKNLLDYHKNCHKFLYGPKPRIPSNTEDLRKLTSKMVATMKNLSVAHTGPLHGFNIDTLSKNCEFDQEDMAVLKKLDSGEDEPGGFELSRKFIPPNYMTLVALRTFTLGWNSIKNLCTFHADVPHHSTRIDPNDRILYSDAKKLFKSRLKTIFAFPLILSNISSMEKPKPVYKPKGRKVGKPLSKRKRKEHAKLMNAAYKNKLKSLMGKFEDSGPVQSLRANELLGSNQSKEKQSKSVSTSKSTVKSEISGANEEVNGTRKRTRSVKSESDERASPLKKATTRNTRRVARSEML